MIITKAFSPVIGDIVLNSILKPDHYDLAINTCRNIGPLPVLAIPYIDRG